MSNGDACAICLEVVQLRGGGVPLHSPGCCGKWFHQKCIVEYVNAGADNTTSKCPSCRSDFEVPPWMRAVPQVPAQQVSAQPFQFQQLPAPPPQPTSFFGMIPRLFSSSSAGATQAPIPNVARTSNPFAFGGRSIVNNTDVTEDLLPEINASTNVATAREKNIRKLQSSISITMTPEYDIIGLSAADAFSVRVGLQYNDSGTDSNTTAETDAKAPGESSETGKSATSPSKDSALTLSTVGLDVVCILDNSGSMTGSKLRSLKTAMEFVIQSLGPNDRYFCSNLVLPTFCILYSNNFCLQQTRGLLLQ